MRVSVIVPHVEDRGYLDKCLSSIRAQTYPCEIITVKSPRSVACNVNRGLEQATGEFVKVVGDDDWLPLDSIQNLVEGIGDAPWVVGNAFDVYRGQYDLYKPPTLDFAANVRHNQIHNGGTMYRTDILREIKGMDESLWTGEEYEMHLRLYSKGYLPVYLDKAVYYYRKWPGQKYKMLNALDRKKRVEEINRIQQMYHKYL